MRCATCKLAARNSRHFACRTWNRNLRLHGVNSPSPQHTHTHTPCTLQLPLAMRLKSTYSWARSEVQLWAAGARSLRQYGSPSMRSCPGESTSPLNPELSPKSSSPNKSRHLDFLKTWLKTCRSPGVKQRSGTWCRLWRVCGSKAYIACTPVESSTQKQTYKTRLHMHVTTKKG